MLPNFDLPIENVVEYINDNIGSRYRLTTADSKKGNSIFTAVQYGANICSEFSFATRN